MFRYKGKKYVVYSDFEVHEELILTKHRLEEEPNSSSKKYNRSPRELRMTKPATKNANEYTIASFVKEGVPYRRGTPSPLTRLFGNPHTKLRPLRVLLYEKFPSNSTGVVVKEEIPEWDDLKEQVIFESTLVSIEENAVEDTARQIVNSGDVDAVFEHFFPNENKYLESRVLPSLASLSSSMIPERALNKKGDGLNDSAYKRHVFGAYSATAEIVCELFSELSYYETVRDSSKLESLGFKKQKWEMRRPSARRRSRGRDRGATRRGGRGRGRGGGRGRGRGGGKSR